MKDTGKERQIYVRPFGVFKPMKSRMFDTNQVTQFKWHYNADIPSGEGIADWFMQWQQNGGKKIQLPKK
jgi:hypothetical protein